MNTLSKERYIETFAFNYNAPNTFPFRKLINFYSNVDAITYFEKTVCSMNNVFVLGEFLNYQRSKQKEEFLEIYEYKISETSFEIMYKNTLTNLEDTCGYFFDEEDISNYENFLVKYYNYIRHTFFDALEDIHNFDETPRTKCECKMTLKRYIYRTPSLFELRIANEFFELTTN